MARTRSPNYPAISLREAIEAVREVYEKKERTTLSREALGNALGFKSLHGTCLQKISALDKYGLVERQGSEYAVSGSAIHIIRREHGDPERSQAIWDAAWRPEIFGKLHEKYGAGRVDADAIRIHLETNCGFKSKAAEVASKSFQDTVEFVTFEAGEHNAPDAQDGGPEGKDVQTEPAATMHGGHTRKPMKESKLAPLVIPTRSGKMIEIRVSSLMTIAELEQIEEAYDIPKMLRASFVQEEDESEDGE